MKIEIGYFKVEIQEALSPLYFDNHQKLTMYFLSYEFD